MITLATGIVYYFAAVFALSLAGGADKIGLIWPPSGILFAAVLASRGRQMGWHLIAAAVASMIANLQAENTLPVSVAFTIANLFEAAFGAWLLRVQFKARVSFADPQALMYFCAAATAATMSGATVATILAPAPSIPFWLNWFSTDLLGVLVLTPMILIIGRALLRGQLGEMLPIIPTASLVFGIVTLSGVAAFFQDNYPLLFLPMLAVLIAALVLGPLGAACGVLIIAAISTIALVAKQGPIVTLYAGTLVRSLFLQLYMLSLLAGALPVAALLAARKQLLERLAKEMRLLQMAESAAQVGHWHLDISTRSLTWSDEVYRIYGVTDDQKPTLAGAIDAYHPDDREVVAARLEQSMANGRGFEFVARIMRPDGETRHVFSKGEIDRSDDQTYALFGIIRDISMQVAQEAVLTEARAQAENAAREATVLAETDQLTGIANRRRTTFVLDQKVLDSKTTGCPISVVMLDIDRFKQVNDNHGHHVGDEVITRVATTAGAELRKGDLIGRVGGEEFLIVLPDTTAQTALGIAERVRSAVERSSKLPKITISAGVAELAAGEGQEELLRRADAALYIAKNEGRNAVRVSHARLQLLENAYSAIGPN